jgi:NAD-dependent SIR2 family protein deacetylase
MKRWTQMKNDRYFCFTSNVDGHWEKAGFPSEKIYECHGSVHYMQCVMSCTNEIWPTTEFVIPRVDESTFRAIGDLPKCKRCGQMARPNVLMFDDWGYLDGRQTQQRQRFNQWLREAIDREWRVVIIEIGAGKAVPTVRIISEEVYVFHSLLIEFYNSTIFHHIIHMLASFCVSPLSLSFLTTTIQYNT